MVLGWPLSPMTVLPTGRFAPVVAVVTTSSPVVGAQSIVKSACPVPPAGTVTVRGFAPLTVQLDATLSATMWSAAASPGYVVPGCADGFGLAIVAHDRVADRQVRACGRGGDDELARRRRAVDREVRVPRATGGHRYRPGIRAAHRAVRRHAQRYHVVCRGEPGVRRSRLCRWFWAGHCRP